MKNVQITISPGEAYDRLSILHIKQAKIKDGEKVAKVKDQYKLLWSEICRYTKDIDVDLDKVQEQYLKLIEINEKLWDIEDDIRDCENMVEFDSRFVKLARAVYHTNDQRHAAKLVIDTLFKSDLAEQKEYTEYEKDNTFGESV